MSQPHTCSLTSTPQSLVVSSQVKPHLPSLLRETAMLQPQIKFASDFRKRRRSGMTLIELLIAISILVIIAAILVPQLRFASADRNLREASRTVASLFAEASQRGINDGEAGVVIERNPNILAADGTAYAGTSLFILRRSPRYSGDGEDAVAERVRLSSEAFPATTDELDVHASDVYIPVPFEQEDLGLVQVDDQISFASQPNIRFVITAVETDRDVVDNIDKLRLSLASASDFWTLEDYIPNPEITEDPNVADVSQQVIGGFSIARRPRKLVSSRVDLPTGYLIDLRLSGPINLAEDQVLFDQDDRSVGTDAVPNSVTYVFNSRGAIDRFIYSVEVADGVYQRASQKPSEPAFLMVREYNTDDGGETTLAVLGNERTMWVTADPATGAANVVSSIPIEIDPDNPVSNQVALRAARTFSSQGQQAAQ